MVLTCRDPMRFERRGAVRFLRGTQTRFEGFLKGTQTGRVRFLTEPDQGAVQTSTSGVRDDFQA